MIDFFEYEENPRGNLRIFGIGTKVEILQTGEIGFITKIGRRTMTVKTGKRSKAFYAYELDIIK